jgi:S1-C subfamily serine protease
MRQKHLLVLGAVALTAVAFGKPLGAQTEARRTDAVDVRALLGANLSFSGSQRDTAGMLVSAVVADGPAARAGLSAGSRVAEVAGVSLQLQRDEVGRTDARDAMMRRLTAALRAVTPGTPLALRVRAGGSSRMLAVQPAASAVAALTSASAPVAVAQSAVPVAVPNVSTSPTSSQAAVPTVTLAQTSKARTPASTRLAPDSAESSVAGAIAAISRLQLQLRRLAGEEESAVPSDTLAQIAQELGDLRKRLRLAQSTAMRQVARARPAADSVPGLRTSIVSEELSAYFGEGSAEGLLVLDADARWAPIRAGDVILRVGDEVADADQLRHVLESREPVTVEVMRRRRPMAVVVRGQ